MDYNTWIPLGHNIAVFIFSCITLCTSTNVLFYKFLCCRSIKLIPILQIHFLYIFIWALFSFVNTVYLIIFWRPYENLYNERLLYLFGVLPDTLLFLNSVMGIFLCADRCFTIAFPLRYGKKCRKLWGFCTTLTMIIIYGIAIWQNRTFDLIPPDRPTTCYYRGCLVGSTTAQNFAPQKLAISVIDIFAGIILFLLIRGNINESNNRKSKRLNIVAVYIVISSTIFDFCPSLFFRFVPLNLEKPLSWYIGPYLISMGSFGVTICGGIYANTFKTTKKNGIVQNLS